MTDAGQNKKSWQEICAEVQKRRDDSIDAVGVPDPGTNLPLNVTGFSRQLLTAREVEITETPTEKLLSLLASGRWSSIEVTNAFLRRAGLAQKLVNCITELVPDRSRNRARELDEYLQKNGKPIGPLHGLPISVKELVGMKGIDVHISFCSWVGNIMEDDAIMIKLLEQAGAVFHARTTEPQTAMHLETSSNLFGVTVNPYNRNLTSGGSSGGEGALIALHGSCLGIGSDIGGSIRNPAANNGIFGLRPTSYRLPIIGFEGSTKALGYEQIVPVAGPLSSSIEGIKIFMKALIDARPWLLEPSLVPIPWREEPLLNATDTGVSLKIGVLWHDGVVKPHPPVLRALKQVVEKLKGAPGIEIVDWTPYKHDYAWQIIASLYFPDGAKTERDAIDSSGEPWMPLSEFIIKENPYVKSLDVNGLWHYTSLREMYRAEYSEHWNKTATGVDQHGHLTGMVDVILGPVGPGAAPPLNCARYWGYTSQWNLLDYPGLAFPVSTVDPTVDLKDPTYQPLNEQDKYNYELYEPDVYIDAPISLQLVGRRYEDEKVIQAYEMMQKYL